MSEELHDWAWACEEVKKGVPLTRRSWAHAVIFWHEGDVYVCLDPQESDETQVYLPAMGDMVASDWHVAEQPEE